MPITAFNSFTDGLDPSHRSREHFITNIDIANDGRWVPYADGVWLQPCHFNCTSGGFSVVLKGLPGAALGTHYHVGVKRHPVLTPGRHLELTPWFKSTSPIPSPPSVAE